MKLLMISGDRSILQGKKGAFWYTLEELSKHWERIDVVCPYSEIQIPKLETNLNIENSNFGIVSSFEFRAFSNVFFHPSPRGLWYQPWWILIKGDGLIKKHHHDVMTVHEYPPFYNGLGARWLHGATNIPYMTEIHHIVGYPRAANLIEWIGYWMSRVWLPTLGTSQASRVRVVSGETETQLLQWGIPKGKLDFLPSLYLDYSVLKPNSSIKKKYEVAFCGRLEANKGLFPVLFAIAKLPNISLLVIGDGSEAFRCRILARNLGISDRVTFVGWLRTNTEVYEAIQSARVFIMNSRSEGGPRVLFEAMALGIPVIATRVGLASNFVVDGMNGLFTNGSVDDLQMKMQSVLADTQMQNRIFEDALETRPLFEKSLLVKNYADDLKKISLTSPS